MYDSTKNLRNATAASYPQRIISEWPEVTCSTWVVWLAVVQKKRGRGRRRSGRDGDGANTDGRRRRRGGVVRDGWATRGGGRNRLPSPCADAKSVTQAATAAVAASGRRPRTVHVDDRRSGGDAAAPAANDRGDRGTPAQSWRRVEERPTRVSGHHTLHWWLNYCRDHPPVYCLIISFPVLSFSLFPRGSPFERQFEVWWVLKTRLLEPKASPCNQSISVHFETQRRFCKPKNRNILLNYRILLIVCCIPPKLVTRMEVSDTEQELALI